jgi:Protein of unknown function (DUF2807).
VSVVNVEFLGVASGASLETDGEITGGVIDLRASSGGMMKATLKAQTLSAIQSSGGVMRVAGTADYIRVESSSGGVFEGYDLTVNKCYAAATAVALPASPSTTKLKAAPAAAALFPTKATRNW